ncbi:hypothetical protein, partial [Noviherbaspirillum sp. ST9]|uniref:hypothetical protein n=1 Tax=Noviherbaspirillum sp. ST9 TaxID=3401606 RepID=UPI003B58B12F
MTKIVSKSTLAEIYIINKMVLLNKFLLCLLFNPCLVLSGTNCSYGGKKDTDNICFVTSKDTTISDMLKLYFRESLITNKKSATAITFLRIAKLSKGYELRIGSFDSTQTKSFLSSKREKVYGFTKH